MPRYPLGIMGKKGFRVCPWIYGTLFARLFFQVDFSQIGMSTLPFGYSAKLTLCTPSTSPNPKVDSAIWLFCHVANWPVQKHNRSAKLLPQKNQTASD
jgi:hypothetical protein